jgi:hypothetical protein
LEASLPKTFHRQIAALLARHPGFICSECIADTLGLPEAAVAMTTIGLGLLDRFESASYHPCSRCGAKTRVIREHGVSLR